MDENVLNSRKNSCKLDGWDGGLLAVLAILTWVAFLPVRHAQFILYDDPDYVTSNPVVQKGITFDGVVWAFTTGHASNWHPITWLSHMLDCELFGLDPMGPHLINVGLHLANAALLFVLLRIMTGFRFPSALTAYLFAIHPAHVESVA
ncbi:MAG TPA: hypothetical protein PLV85_11310, partial [Polyangiaceae bacterium]|nr:hypothetical protein [Polyangiaceae bacterium]